jgi:hypothetical protein
LTDFNSVKSKHEKFEYSIDLKKLLKQQNESKHGDDFEMKETSSEDSDENKNVFKFCLGDFSFEQDGSLNIILSNNDLKTPIYLIKVNLKFSSNGTSIEGHSELVSTLNLSINSDEIIEKNKLLFTSNECARYFCLNLVSNTPGHDKTQIYRPKNLSQNLLDEFVAQDSQEEFRLIKTIHSESSLLGISMPKSSFVYKDLIDNRFISSNDQLQVLYMIFSYKNGTNSFVDCLNFNQFHLAKIEHQEPLDSFEAKKIKFDADNDSGEFLLSLDQSFSGLLGVGLTSRSNIVTFRNLHFNYQLIAMQNLHEYSMLSGHDHWDMAINTNPKYIDNVLDRLEHGFQSQIKSVQKIYFSRFSSILFSILSRKSSTNQQSRLKPFDQLIKLSINRSMSIVSYSIQLILNLEQLRKSLNQTIESNLSNTLNITLFTSNLDALNQAIVSPNSNSTISSNVLNQISFKSNLYEYMSDLLDQSSSYLKQMNLNDIVQFIISKKNYQLSIGQQLKHVFQFQIDLALFLISNFVISKNGYDLKNSTQTKRSSFHYGLGLLNDSWFLKELLKMIIYIKLILSHVINQQQTAEQQKSNFAFLSVPVLSTRSSLHKDVLTDIFNIYMKILLKVLDGKFFKWLYFGPMLI